MPQSLSMRGTSIASVISRQSLPKGVEPYGTQSPLSFRIGLSQFLATEVSGTNRPSPSRRRVDLATPCGTWIKSSAQRMCSYLSTFSEANLRTSSLH